MYDLNTVYKSFKKILPCYNAESIEYIYYSTIMKYLLLEHKYEDEVLKAGKPILHYFKYHLPKCNREYFEFLYNPYSPIRFAIETFDSIESIKKELTNDN